MKRLGTIIMILPEGTPGRIVRLNLSAWGRRTLILVTVLGLVWCGVTTQAFLRQKEVLDRCAALENEARVLRLVSEERDVKIHRMTEELSRLREQSRFIKGFLGLDSKGSLKGSLGQGGEAVSLKDPAHAWNPSPCRLSVEGNPMDPAPPEALQAADLETLARDFDAIIETLKRRQKELDRTPSISLVDPKKSWISSSYGPRVSPFTGKRQFHLGVDLAAWKGTPIMATADGKVSYVGKMGPLGLVVKIRHNSIFTTLYGHLLKAEVKRGQRVERGQVIGLMGNSGRSTGYHVHYAVVKRGRYADPTPYLMDRMNGRFFLADSTHSQTRIR
ncbi:MAG: M23 family metallopeptidase [Deltaproteobacteria bacterium]|nr:M23 family metallopeptidase [Deltaproteobacteria bacterium]